MRWEESIVGAEAMTTDELPDQAELDRLHSRHTSSWRKYFDPSRSAFACCFSATPPCRSRARVGAGILTATRTCSAASLKPQTTDGIGKIPRHQAAGVHALALDELGSETSSVRGPR